MFLTVEYAGSKKKKRVIQKLVCALPPQSRFIAVQGALITSLASTPEQMYPLSVIPRGGHFACGLHICALFTSSWVH